MRKLTLDPESLCVESFLPSASAVGRGTVRGAQMGVATVPNLPIGVDTGCTAPCMSNQSECPILSCGSDCDPDGAGFRV